MKTTGIAVLLCILLAVFALPASAVQTDNTLILPADLTEIAPEAFLGLNSAEKVIVPATVTKIGSRAFAGCGTLSVMLPDDLEDIEPDVFEGGNAIALVRSGSKAKDACVSSNIPCLVYKTGTDQVTIEKCSGSVSSIAIPGEIEGLPVTGIGSSAFEDHAALESVLLPES